LNIDRLGPFGLFCTDDWVFLCGCASGCLLTSIESNALTRHLPARSLSRHIFCDVIHHAPPAALNLRPVTVSNGLIDELAMIMLEYPMLAPHPPYPSASTPTLNATKAVIRLTERSQRRYVEHIRVGCVTMSSLSSFFLERDKYTLL
jgi:hypothetical protein